MADGVDLSDPSLFAHEAARFAGELSDTVQRVLGKDVADFSSIASAGRDGIMAAYVRQADNEGIDLASGGRPVLTMQVRMRLTPDTVGRHLRVVKSGFDVTPFGGTEPVFRYEYDRRMEDGRLPAAHVQFHGRHKQLEKALVGSGRKTTRSTRHGKGPSLRDLHFPLGGTRFRPCFEDVLHMLIEEFHVDVPDRKAALAALADGRARWRDMQLRAAVRDDMEGAAEVLRRHDYQVESPVPRPAVNEDRLRRL